MGRCWRCRCNGPRNRNVVAHARGGAGRYAHAPPRMPPGRPSGGFGVNCLVQGHRVQECPIRDSYRPRPPPALGPEYVRAFVFVRLVFFAFSVVFDGPVPPTRHSGKITEKT
ncbi:hypothetical protein GWI33_012236 [Rhynchophorus ferrugineus]|uniref:Uncharacterized protein n=1 Tax=Rhynchophorus ferrugineus TaxID=354439 RepID=A0A834IBM9_RHYFE|nr:hypothetical protein GWI33_012236 [Rhynchophorus ferrugineus]